eukprot:TRINITY_DN3586_c0_g2_i1.p1 TRINITY_DN3586_c0_g2~~TRINITY_DN3586_c0_g2_i1.p1  ORF type:complete len:351 (+),score=94.24 TRINITY_DN3586_c0_g2_i1:131-1183(+)
MQGPLDVMEPSHQQSALLQLNPALTAGMSSLPSHHQQLTQLNPIVDPSEHMHQAHEQQKRSRDEFEDQNSSQNPMALVDPNDKDPQSAAKRKKAAKAGRKLRSPTKHFTKEEDDEIVHLQTLYDNDWSQILKHSRLLQANGRHVESIAHHVRYLNNRNKDKIDEKDKKKDKSMDPNPYSMESHEASGFPGNSLPENFLSEQGQAYSLDASGYPTSTGGSSQQSMGNPLSQLTSPQPNKKKRTEEMVHPTAERRILEQIRVLKETVSKLKKELKMERKERKASQEAFDKLADMTSNIERMLSMALNQQTQQIVPVPPNHHSSQSFSGMNSMNSNEVMDVNMQRSTLSGLVN